MEITLLGSCYLRYPDWKTDFKIPYADLKHLYQTSALRSFVILSTCNRLEIYATEANILEIQALWKEICTRYQLPFEGCYYMKHNDEALLHLFSVILGLESRVFKETQIVSQIKEAQELCLKEKKASSFLYITLQEALSLNKKIRQKYQKKISLGSVVSDFLEIEQKNNEKFLNILIIGAGEITRDLIKQRFFQKNRKIALTISNRTYARALAVQQSFPLADMKILAFENIHSQLSEYNLIVTAIEASEPIIRSHDLPSHQSFLLINLGAEKAIPADITQTCPYARLLHLKDFSIQGDVVNHKEMYYPDMLDAIKQIKRKTLVLNNNKDITKMRSCVYAQSEMIIKKALQQLRKGIDPEIVIYQLSYKMTQKLLHYPSVALKQSMLQSHHLDSFYHSDAISLSRIENLESL